MYFAYLGPPSGYFAGQTRLDSHGFEPQKTMPVCVLPGKSNHPFPYRWPLFELANHVERVVPQSAVADCATISCTSFREVPTAEVREASAYREAWEQGVMGVLTSDVQDLNH